MPLDHENVKVGDRVSYEDMANPTRYGAVLEVIERGGKTPSGLDLPSGREYRVGWDSDYGWLGPETVSDLRQHGWNRVEVRPVETHRLESDPPHGLSRASRRTCADCGAAVLQMPGGVPYGSATERTCEEQKAHNERMRKILG